MARHAAGMAALAEFFFHRTEIGRKSVRIALFVALQIGAAFLKIMAVQTTTILGLQGAEMRLMDKFREAALLALDRRSGEIDGTAFAWNIIDAVAFCA